VVFVTRTVRLSDDHLQRFAEASGDRNPLHLDELFARQTPYGRCIAQGSLATIVALGVAESVALRHVQFIDAQFKRPVFPGEEYDVSRIDSDRKVTRIELTGGGTVALAVKITSDVNKPPLARPSREESAALLSSPRHYRLEDLLNADLSVSEQYACRVDLLSALAAELGSGHVPESILVWLSAASYTVGMLVPGRNALFVGAGVARSAGPGSGSLSVSTSVVDDRTGLVLVDAALDQKAASARMTLNTFLRASVPAPNRSSISRYLAPSDELSGRNVLVVGASRGLGAALCGAFATQGASVWAGFARSTGAAEELRREFGADRIHLLQFDAEDAAETRSGFETLRAEIGKLDGIVLCAAPPLYDTTVHPDASEGTLRFLSSSVAMVLKPLAEAVQQRLLPQDGWLVVLSSSALDDPPEAWPHYVVAKAAVEGVAAYWARQGLARVLVVRAPKMWTDSTNTPMGRIAATETEGVAAGIVRRTMGEDPPSGELRIIRPADLLEGPRGSGRTTA
jgi:NAD(P)-dependent dehydrogenase (short-subunit alcohol dehydrogenase family)/acyl dehydratase